MPRAFVIRVDSASIGVAGDATGALPTPEADGVTGVAPEATIDALLTRNRLARRREARPTVLAHLAEDRHRIVTWCALDPQAGPSSGLDRGSSASASKKLLDLGDRAQPDNAPGPQLPRPLATSLKVRAQRVEEQRVAPADRVRQ